MSFKQLKQVSYGNPIASKLSTTPSDGGGVLPVMRYDVSIAGLPYTAKYNTSNIV